MEPIEYDLKKVRADAFAHGVIVTAKTWEELGATTAANEARENYENNFSSRRGVIPYEGIPIVVFYDNNPPTERHPNGTDVRDRLIGGATAELESLGLRVIGAADYGEQCVDGRYTRAVVFYVPEGMDYEAAEEEVLQTFQRYITDVYCGGGRSLRAVN